MLGGEGLTRDMVSKDLFGLIGIANSILKEHTFFINL